MPLALLALALGGFGIGLTEFVIAGLLPEVAQDLQVSEAAAGMLISGYALSVAVGALGLTALVNRLNRKHVLSGLMILFIAGNLVSALAPSYELLLLGRILSALTHGAFFGIGAVVAASLVERSKQAGAIALMFGGLTTANVLGVPLGTLLGQQLGWRSTFWAITVIGVLALIGMLVLLPDRPVDKDAPGLRHEVTAFRDRQVWFSLGVTVLGFGGMFGAFTYIAFTLTGVSGFASSWVPGLLILFGLGMFAGNLLGGRRRTAPCPAPSSSCCPPCWWSWSLFALLAGSQIATVLLLMAMGAFGFATVPALQMRIMGDAGEAPTLASGCQHRRIQRGQRPRGLARRPRDHRRRWRTRSPLWVGAALTAGALIVLVVAEK